MASDLIEAVRQGFELFNEHGNEQLLELVHPDVEAFIQEDLPNGGHWYGLEGYRRMLESWTEAWDAFTVEPVEFEERGSRVLVRVRQHARTGELALDGEFFYVFALTDGRVSLWHLYTDEARARAVAGAQD